jgi:hypothetical protein
MIKTRVAGGRLIALHRGVYAVGHARLRREGWWLAAVLAVGPGAVLSHRDAAGLHGLRAANHRSVDVTTTRRGRASTDRVMIHRTTVLRAADITILDGIPVTTVARTLVDLAGILPRHQLAKALGAAEVNGVLDARAVEAALTRTAGRHGKGHAVLRTALADHANLGPTLTRSQLEDRFVALLDAHGLPRPRLNAHVEGREVDVLWPGRKLVVELDGYAFHKDRQAFQRDREKTNALVAAGCKVLRFTYEDVVRRPRHVAARIESLLS